MAEREARQQLSNLWIGACACFCLAGLSGVLFRGAILGLVGMGWDVENIRHGHSHLMVFGWLTPALFVLMTLRIHKRNRGLNLKPFKFIIAVTLGLAVLSFPFFLLYGYGPTPIGGLPLSTMISGVSMLAWYGFAGCFLYGTRKMRPGLPLVLWQGGLFFLVLGSLGAWGISLLHLTKSAAFFSPKALTHWFLFLFKEGWCVPALVGLAACSLGVMELKPYRVLAVCLWFCGLPLAVPTGMPAQMMAEIFPYSTRIGTAMVAVGLGQNLLELIWVSINTRRYKWLAPLFFLSLKALALFVAALLPLTHLTTHHGVGLLYLHVMLLGGLTLGLVACACYEGYGFKHFWLLCGSVLALIVSLVPFTPFWPAAWLGRWVWMAAFWLAIPPILCLAAYVLPVFKPLGRASSLVVLEEPGEVES